ncbi:MAG: HAD family hydrolase [Eubacteriales bacterium]
MTYPKMIIFDYGHTLLCEPGWDPARGNAALMKYVVKNEKHCTVEDVVKHAEIIFNQHISSLREFGYEISGQVGDKFLYEYLGIEFSLTPLEMETEFWNGASMGAVMPNADKMLDYVNEKGIRSAVISNLLWSGEALAERLNRLLPNNRFEFVITSSDYMFRKPNRLLFELALRKTGLDAADVWYCGDNPQADVEGAAQVGIFPVWYDNALECEYRDKSKEPLPKCEYLLIHEWDEMIEVLDGLK